MHQMIRRFTSIVNPTLSISEVNSRVKDLVSKGLYEQTLQLYKEQLHPNALSHATTIFIFPSVIKACSNAQNHNLGLQLHCFVLRAGSAFEPIICNSLISMYAKFSEVECARTLFDTMPQRDTITWNSMINCYIQNGFYLESLILFKDMFGCGFVPKPELIASVISVCGKTKDLRLGRGIHGLVIVDDMIESSVLLSTSLVDFYLRCQDLFMACNVFDQMEFKNEVSWTAMISGCVANHNYDIALDCLQEMQFEGIKPNRVTVLTILPVCAMFGSVKHGKEIHGYAFRHGFDWDFHLSSALIHVYCKCKEESRHAKLIFERSKEKDVVMWSSIITSYSQSEDSAQEAIELFHQMQMEGIEPNNVTLLAVVSACTNLSSTKLGRTVQGHVLKFGLISDLFIGNSLINMYSKCGSLADSQQIFREMPIKDSISWSTIISAHGLHGRGEEACRLFHEMDSQGVEPDEITFLAILSACDHSGLVEEGQSIFVSALQEGKIALTIEHYACLIGLLGRAGKLEEACEFLTTMPIEPSSRIWSSLISACKVHERLDVTEMLAHRLIESEPENATNYTLLCMVYAESGKWDRVEEVRRDMRERGLRKSRGLSRIELENDNS